MKHLVRVAAAAAVVSLLAVTLGASNDVARAAGHTSGGSTATSQPFSTILVYDQANLSFPALAAPANQRIIIREVHVNVLVDPGDAPIGSIWVPPSDPANTGYLGAHQEVLSFTQVSNFQNVQTRFAFGRSTSFALEPGQQLTWYLSHRDGENAFTANQLTASMSISGEIVTLN